MQSYEDLRLDPSDKIEKIGFFSKLFKKDSKITKENLDFLEENIQQKEEEFNPYLDFLDDKNLYDTKNESLNQDSKEELPLEESISINAEEKEEILEEILNPNADIPFRFVALCLCAMLLFLALFIPKIYIRNNIYYASRNIIQLQAQLDSLNEENKFIKKQLENIKFKNLTQELDF